MSPHSLEALLQHLIHCVELQVHMYYYSLGCDFLDSCSPAVISLRDPSHGDGREGHQIEMYLHRKFHNYTEILLV